MPIKTNKELFVMLLSNVWQGAERSAKIYQEMGQAVQDKGIKEALEARCFVANQNIKTLEECFRLMGEKPVKLVSKMSDTFVEDFHREIAEIQTPETKALFVLTKACHLTHLRIGEYVALVAAADLTGHHGVGVLLQSIAAEKLAFAERTRHFIRNMLERRMATQLAA
jgi:ferritin-like metal-binding protein YciE